MLLTRAFPRFDEGQNRKRQLWYSCLEVAPFREALIFTAWATSVARKQVCPRQGQHLAQKNNRPFALAVERTDLRFELSVQHHRKDYGERQHRHWVAPEEQTERRQSKRLVVSRCWDAIFSTKEVFGFCVALLFSYQSFPYELPGVWGHPGA